MTDIETVSLPQRVVLLSVATLEQDDDTPVPVNIIARRAREFADDVPEVGALTEAEVDSALNKLEADSYVTVASMDDTSPVGKGRPAFELATDVEALLAALADDDRLDSVFDHLETA